MTTPDLAAIVRKMSAGQRNCIMEARSLDAAVFGRSGEEVRGRSANSLTLKGLAEGREIRSFTGRSRRGIALTPLGMQVRAHLLSEANDV